METAVLWTLIGCSSSSPIPLADGVKIDKLTWSQGTEVVWRNTTEDFAGGHAPPPVVQGREGLLRVYVSAERPGAWRERQLEVHVEVQGQPVRIREVDPSTDWHDAQLGSTANVWIPAAEIGPDFALTVTLREPGGAGDAAVLRRQVWWASDEHDVRVQPTDVLSLHLLPFEVDGFVPDTGEEVVALVRDRLFATFPVSEVEVVVEPVRSWEAGLGPAEGWEALLAEVSALRADAVVPPNTYFYGLVEPAESAEAFCASSTGFCTGGVGTLPEGPSEPWHRAAVGLGYDSVADTLVHELGHSHGRRHTPCGGAGYPDLDFPYDDGEIGGWGLDLVTQQLRDPRTHRDFMSYCQPAWTSDHTFTALRDRIADVASSDRSVSVPWSTALRTASGWARGPALWASPTPSGQRANTPFGPGWATALADTTGQLVLLEDPERSQAP